MTKEAFHILMMLVLFVNYAAGHILNVPALLIIGAAMAANHFYNN